MSDTVNLVIAISGLHGCGKSTFAKLLAEEFNLRYFSTGYGFRQLSKERGMSLEEFTTYAENNPSIDEELDRLAKEEAKKGKIVIEFYSPEELERIIKRIKGINGQARF